MKNQEIFQLELLKRIKTIFYDSIVSKEEYKKLNIDFELNDCSSERIYILLSELFPCNGDKVLKKVETFIEELIEKQYLELAQIILQKIVENNSVEAKSWLLDMVKVEEIDNWLRNMIKEELFRLGEGHEAKYKRIKRNFKRR